MASQAADVFVSYKAEDRSRLIPLVTALEAEGFSVWWDTHIGGGSHWREDIREHLDAAKCVIVAWTKRSVGPGNDFVCDEAARARRRGAYLPIELDAVEPPLGFGEIQAISLKGWHGDRADPRFQALVDAVRANISGEPISHAYAQFREPRISRRTAIAGSIGIGTIAVIGAAGWLLLKPAPANAKRIAVLPFANLSGGEAQSYFAEGIAEELRSALSRIGMEVVGRTSSDAVREMDAKAAAAKLDVPHILTGSVRRSTETIRVNAQLVSGKDGIERWAQTYDRAPGDAIKIQTDIATSVAQALSIALGQAGQTALTLGGTADSIAQDLILQSRKLGHEAANLETFRRRVALAERAIARDPRYADAHVEKANALSGLAARFAPTPAALASQLAEADAAARKARTLAPKLGSAHDALATIALYRQDFGGALRDTKEAVALAPKDADVLASAANNIGTLVSADDGVRFIDRAIALDPLNGLFYRIKAEMLIYARRHRQAVEAGRKALALTPSLKGAHLDIGDAFLLSGHAGQAKSEYEAIETGHPMHLARLALLAARSGDRAEAEQMMTQLRQKYGAAASYQYGEIYAQLGDRDRAFVELDNAIEAKDPGLGYVKVDPFLDPIRSDPRFAALVRKLRFP